LFYPICVLEFLWNRHSWVGRFYMAFKKVNMRRQIFQFNKLILLSLVGVVLLTACSGPAASQTGGNNQSVASVTPEVLHTEAEATLTSTSTEVIPTETSQPTQASTAETEMMVSFANDINPILQSRCVSCHGGSQPVRGLDMSTYASLMAGSQNGAVIVPGDVEKSLFVEMVATQMMPKRGEKLTAAQIKLFSDWVAQGALDN